MKLIVGLGNPGPKYSNTRHNSGFVVAQKLSEGQDWKETKSSQYSYSQITIGDESVLLVTPQTYMNKSGHAVKDAQKELGYLPPENIYIVHDDLDIPLGKFKIQFGKGPKEHHGIQSIETTLGTTDFWRVRVGVENRTGGQAEISGEEYVLKPFSPAEKEIMTETIKKIVTSLTDQIMQAH